MVNYIIRRLILLPITLFAIVLVNFIVINLAPGDPVTITEISQEGNASRKEGQAMAFGSDDRYLQFRERYGLTLPILFNLWPEIDAPSVKLRLNQLKTKKEFPGATQDMNVKDYDKLRISFGDQARFVMPHLLALLQDPALDIGERRLASSFFVRGGTQQAYVGPNLSEEQKQWNRKISKDNVMLRELRVLPEESQEEMDKKVTALTQWYLANRDYYEYVPTGLQKVRIFFSESRFFKYFSRVITLDFGTLRNNDNKTVISEVIKRFRYSLTLAVIPMIITFVLCQVFGFVMAFKHNRWPDYSLNVFFLILFAIPIFVVAPFLIEKVALNNTFFFSEIPIPINDFTSPDRIYNQMTSKQRLFDVIQHLALPLTAIMYGELATQSRLSRTAVLEVLRQDYVRTAKAKGVPPFTIMTKHVGRNAAITIVTSLAGTLGVVLGGSLIVETLFGINGFGKFFYDAVINRDYNVIMFSSLAGAFLTLLGYLIGDIAYTLLDPRVTLY